MPDEEERIIAEDPFNRRLSGVRKARPTQETNQSFVGKGKNSKEHVEKMLNKPSQSYKNIPIMKDEDESSPLAPDIQAQLKALAQMPNQGKKSSSPGTNPNGSSQFQHPLNAPPNPLKPELAGQPELLGTDYTPEHVGAQNPGGSANYGFTGEAGVPGQPILQEKQKREQDIRRSQQQAPIQPEQAQLQQSQMSPQANQPRHTVSAAKEAQQDQIEKTYFYDDQIKTIFNFRYAMRQLVKEVKRANRHQRPLSVCIMAFHEMDIIRNKFGELAVDASFRTLGQILPKYIDLDMEIAGRYGDQIVIALPEFMPPNAAQLLDEVRRELEQTAIQHRQYKFALKASIGIAGFQTHGNTWKELLVKAEQASIQAIERGGNTIAFPPRG